MDDDRTRVKFLSVAGRENGKEDSRMSAEAGVLMAVASATGGCYTAHVDHTYIREENKRAKNGVRGGREGRGKNNSPRMND